MLDLEKLHDNLVDIVEYKGGAIACGIYSIMYIYGAVPPDDEIGYAVVDLEEDGDIVFTSHSLARCIEWVVINTEEDEVPF